MSWSHFPFVLLSSAACSTSAFQLQSQQQSYLRALSSTSQTTTSTPKTLDDITASVRIDSTNGLRGLYANRDFNAKEILFEIPYELALLVGDTLVDGENGNKLIESDLDVQSEDKDTVYDVYQALRLLNNIHSGNVWESQVQYLPPPNSSNEGGQTPDFWEEELIYELQIPEYIRQIMERKQIVGEVARKNNVDEDKLRWATCMIRSRRFTTWDTVDHPEEKGVFGFPKKVDQIKGFLLPLIDMANHSNDPNAEMKISVNPWTRRFDNTSKFALHAVRPIGKDEEITISYGEGDWTCLQMMDKYGFFLEGCEADEKYAWDELKCCFTTTVEEDEKEKRELLEKKDGHFGSRINMLSMRILVKRMMDKKILERFMNKAT